MSSAHMEVCLLLVIAFLVAQSAPLPAAHLGLDISLVSEGYLFNLLPRPPPSPAKNRKPSAAPVIRETFTCSVAVVNRSTSDVTLTYESETATADRFTFCIYNSEGDVLWISDSLTSVEVTAPSTVTLKKKSVLRRTIQIPLKVGGAWLPSGHYTLEASAGLSGPTATTIFEVIAPPPTTPPITPPTTPPVTLPPGQMIGGVMFVGDYGETGLPASVTLFPLNSDGGPAAGSSLSTRTDAAGKYTITAPPGSYSIQVLPDDPNLIPGGNFLPDVVGAPPGPRTFINVVSGGSESIFFHYVKDELHGTVLAPLPITLSTTFLPRAEHGRYDSLEIGATTLTSKSGYSKPMLVPRNTPPNSGVVEFDFRILPPTTAIFASQVYTTSYQIAISLPTTTIRSIRVYGDAGSVVLPFNPNHPTTP